MRSANADPPESALIALGFTDTEARIYCELLRGGPATGYRLAQAIGKAAANTYQALASLTQKGAVLVDDGDARAFRAVPPAELLGALERGFAHRKDEAEAALATLRPAVEDDRIYQLKTVDQTLARARALIDSAREIILFDAFPTPLQELAPHLAAASARGVTIAGIAYGPLPAEDVGAVVSHGAAFVAERWPGQQLALVADAREHLTVLFSLDGREVLHGVWSDSAFLACMKHSGLASEIRLSALVAQDIDPLASLSLLRSNPAGLRALLASRPSLHRQENPGDAA